VTLSKIEVQMALLRRVASGADLTRIEDDARSLMAALDVVDQWPALSAPATPDTPSTPCETQ